ncbi:hypothetical protein BH23CHL5_BH23CHL5_11280 [soil metagenome]
MLDFARMKFDLERWRIITTGNPHVAQPSNQQGEHCKLTAGVVNSGKRRSLYLRLQRTHLPAAPQMVAAKAGTTASDRFQGIGS